MNTLKNHGLMALLLCGLMLYAGSCRDKEEEPSLPPPPTPLADSAAFCRGYDALDFPTEDQFHIALQNRTWKSFGYRAYNESVKDTVFRRNFPPSSGINIVFESDDSLALFEKTHNWDTGQMYMKRVRVHKYDIRRNEWGRFCAEFTSKEHDEIKQDSVLFRVQYYLCSSGEQLISMGYSTSAKEPNNWKNPGSHGVYYLIK